MSAAGRRSAAAGAARERAAAAAAAPPLDEQQYAMDHSHKLRPLRLTFKDEELESEFFQFGFRQQVRLLKAQLVLVSLTVLYFFTVSPGSYVQPFFGIPLAAAFVVLFGLCNRSEPFLGALRRRGNDVGGALLFVCALYLNFSVSEWLIYGSAGLSLAELNCDAFNIFVGGLAGSLFCGFVRFDQAIFSMFVFATGPLIAPLLTVEFERPGAGGIAAIWAPIILSSCVFVVAQWERHYARRLMFLHVRHLRNENVAITLTVEKIQSSRFSRVLPLPSSSDDRSSVTELLDPLEVDPTTIRMGPLIGHGGFAKVFKATWRGTTVAVKALALSAHKDRLDSVASELELLVHLRHPNVVLFMGFSVKNDDMLFLYEYMDCGSLYDLLHREKAKLPLAQRTSMLAQAAQGVSFLHSSTPPILHKDLKTANLLVDSRMNVKIGDLGISSFKDHRNVDTGVGSLLYAAPEAAQGEPYTEKADVYSFGIILWEVIFKQVPYNDVFEQGAGVSAFSVVYQVVAKNLRPTITEQCPLAFAELMRACWDPEPSNRPTSDDVARRIAELVAEFDTEGSVDTLMLQGSSTWKGRELALASHSASVVELAEGSSSAFIPSTDKPAVVVFFAVVRSYESEWVRSPVEHRIAVQTALSAARVLISEHGGSFWGSDADGSFFCVFPSPQLALRHTLAIRTALDLDYCITMDVACVDFADPDDPAPLECRRMAAMANRVPSVVVSSAMADSNIAREVSNKDLITPLGPPPTRYWWLEPDTLRKLPPLREHDSGNFVVPAPGWIVDGPEIDCFDALGAGPLGESFVAKVRGGRPVVFKHLSWDPSAAPSGAKMSQLEWMQQIAHLAKQRHPNLAEILFVSPQTGHVGIVTHHYQESLASLLADAPVPMPPSLLRTVLLGCARGLAHLHAEGITHGCLKPSNIMFDDRGAIKLTDFGIAPISPNLLDLAVTGRDRLWVAPELLAGQGPRALRPALDLYPAGILIWRLTDPNWTDSTQRCLDNHGGSVVSPVGILPAETPPNLLAVFCACVMTDPAVRPTSSELVERLEATL